MMSYHEKNAGYLQTTAENYELIVASFFVTNPGAMKRLRGRWAERDLEHKMSNSRGGTSDPVNSKTFGGSVCLFDPQRLSAGLLAEIECPVATGMLYEKDEKCIYVGSDKTIKRIEGGKITSSFGNNLFSDIHGLSLSLDGNILVVSTGIDGIIEIDPISQSIVWDWLATENGYDKNPEGKKRIINRELDYRQIETSTPEHTTHINSCLEYKPGKILATLFHQGCLIEIDKGSKKTRKILDGLKCPHAIRKRNDGFIISDTLGNRVLLLDENLKIKKVLTGNYYWIQDTIELQDGKFLIEDSNNGKFVKVDSSGYIDECLEIDKDARKMFSLLAITKRQAMDIFNLP